MERQRGTRAQAFKPTKQPRSLKKRKLVDKITYSDCDEDNAIIKIQNSKSAEASIQVVVTGGDIGRAPSTTYAEITAEGFSPEKLM